MEVLKNTLASRLNSIYFFSSTVLSFIAADGSMVTYVVNEWFSTCDKTNSMPHPQMIKSESLVVLVGSLGWEFLTLYYLVSKILILNISLTNAYFLPILIQTSHFNYFLNYSDL